MVTLGAAVDRRVPHEAVPSSSEEGIHSKLTSGLEQLCSLTKSKQNSHRVAGGQIERGTLPRREQKSGALCKGCQREASLNHTDDICYKKGILTNNQGRLFNI